MQASRYHFFFFLIYFYGALFVEFGMRVILQNNLLQSKHAHH